MNIQYEKISRKKITAIVNGIDVTKYEIDMDTQSKSILMAEV